MWKRARGEMLLDEIKVPESTPLSKEQPLCFCATLSGRGTQSKRSNHLEEFFPLIRKASLTWVDIKVDDFEKDAVETSTKMGFSELLVTQLLTRLADRGRFQGGYEDFDTEMGLLIPAISMEGFDIVVNPLLVLLKKGLIVTIRSRKTHIFHNLHRYAETFLEKLPQNLQLNDWLTLMLIRILDENIERNFAQLQEIDKGSEDITKDLKGDTVVRSTVGDQIFQMKLTLVRYLSCLWATLDTLNSLQNGDADLVSDEAQVLDKISMLVREVRDQLSLAENQTEILASGLESLQAIYNNQLQDKNNLLQEKNNTLADLNNKLQEKNNRLQDYNNRMTLANNRLTVLNNRITLLGGFLAIISAGFVVPNTIATVMSQTNIFLFSPADMGWYLTLIVASTIVAIMLVWSWVKSKGLLPNKQEEEEERYISVVDKESIN